MAKKIYISLPISHYDLEERKEYAQRIEDVLSHFYEVVNPLKNGIPEDADWRVHMKKDIQMLLECDAIFLCKDWEKSKGCKLEFDVATTCGIEPIYEVLRVPDKTRKKLMSRKKSIKMTSSECCCSNGDSFVEDGSDTNHDRQNKFLTVEELCKYLKVCRTTVWRLSKIGILKPRKIGGRVLFDRAEIDDI